MALFLTAAALLVLAVAATAVTKSGIPITVVNTEAEAAVGAPVSAGVPFARSALRDASTLALAAEKGRPAPLQSVCTAKWPDGSCRWVLLDFAADVAAGGNTSFVLVTSGENPAPENAVAVTADSGSVTLSNGVVAFSASVGGRAGILESADGEASAEIVSVVEIGKDDGCATSQVVFDSLDVYADGPVRAAVAICGRRIYSDGVEGPFSQRVEMFAGSPFVRVEDTFIYAHFPGTHAEPENPLALWKVEAVAGGNADRLKVASLAADEEAEGLVICDTSVAFWGLDEPFDLSRHTDEDLVGEGCRGIALGLGKSCALLVGLLGEGADEKACRKPVRHLCAHTTPEVYCQSGALGEFAAAAPGEFEALEEGMKRTLGFWLYFQDNDPDGVFGRGAWHGLFDWGDWQSACNNRRTGAREWTYHEGRYGWDSNEMDTTLGLWAAFFHTGGSEYWRAAVAMSRHMMDVDMINVDYRKYNVPEYVYDHHHYYGGAPWREGFDRMVDMNTIGLGRRHNVQHWGEGVGDTRHGWNGGILMYYYLTGNRRAYDAVLAMADMQMQRMFGNSAGEYSLGMWCLYNAWQLTGSEKYHDEFKYRLDLVDRFQMDDGGIAGHINVRDGTNYPEVDKGRSVYLDLTLDYISSVLIEYHWDTGDAAAKKILMGLAERNMADEPEKPGDLQRIDALRLFAWAYFETGDMRFIERAKYHITSLEASGPAGELTNPQEWIEAVTEILDPYGWSIRHIGPGIRMAPYAMKAIAESEKPVQ